MQSLLEMTLEDQESWLDQARWVRALARDVLRDTQLAEDVTQEALLAAWRGGSAPMGDPAGLRSWLAATAHNLARMTRRSESNRRARERDVAAQRPSSTDPIDERNEIQRRVAESLAALPPEDREVIVLRYFDGLSAAEIARRLGTTPNAVSTRLSRARKKLRAILDEPTTGGRSSSPSWAFIALGMGYPSAASEAVTSGIDVIPGETVEVTLPLSDGKPIIGRVFDESDRGFPNAEIWLSQGNGGPTTSMLAGYSDEQGRFEIPHTMDLQAVGARANGAEPSVQKMPHVVKPNDPEIGTKLVLKGLGGQLSGRVVDRTARRKRRIPMRRRHRLHYALPSLQTGPVEATAMAERGKRGTADTVRIHADGETVWSPSLPSPLAIVGRALSAGETPLAGFHVRGSASAETGPMARFQVDVKADGRFELPCLPQGQYELTFAADGFVSITFDLASPLLENEVREIPEVRLAKQP